MREEFEILVDRRLAEVKRILLEKGKEYQTANNPFHNFIAGAKITGETPQKVLDNYLMKHYVSYRDMLTGTANNVEYSEELIKEKFGDIINYFIIQEAMFLIKPNVV